MSIVRIGLGETKHFAEGYEAIFGKKIAATPKKKPKKAKKSAARTRKKSKKK